MSNENYEEVNPEMEANEEEQEQQVEKMRLRDRIPKWVKIAGIAGGALIGTVLFGKLFSPDAELEEVEDVPFTEPGESE